MKILVIEDQENLRNDILFSLECLDYEGIGAENGVVGVELARTHKPDIILSDIMMPELDGYGVLTALRQDPVTATIPFIFLSAKADKTDIRQGMNLGAEDYLTKPFTIEELAKAIDTQLEKRQIMERESQKSLDELRTNIVQHQKAENELHTALNQEKELNEIKQNFISLAAHELRTPLTVILGCSDMLKFYGHRLSEEEKLKHFNKIQSQVQNMIQLLDEVLLIEKKEAGRFDFTLETLNLSVFCREILEDISLAKTKDHNFIFEVEGDAVSVKIDKKLVRTILTNLVSNAIKYSSQAVTVKVKLVCEREQAIFQIQDSGIGIPVKDLKHLFERFYRASNVSTISGTGLGLAIVKQAVELHKGKISVESEEGVGTTFTVSVPTNSIL